MYRPIWIDKVIGSDPALNRLVSTSVTIISMGLCILAEWILVDTSGALGSKIPAVRPTSTQIALHHEVVVLAVLIGGMLALTLGFSFDENTLKGAAISTFMPAIPLLATTFITLLLGNHKDFEIAFSAILLGIGTLFRKYGSRGSGVGMMMYVGGFFGYFLSLQFGMKSFGWFALEVLVAVLVILATRVPYVQFQAKSALNQAINSYTSKARLVTRVAIHALMGNEIASRKLRKEMSQLNETALIIESYMSKDKHASPEMRQSLFDLELSLTNIARFSEAIGRLKLPSIITRDISDFILAIPEQKHEKFSSEIGESLRRWRTFLPKGETVTHIILGRLTDSIVNLNQAAQNWRYYRQSENSESNTAEKTIGMNHVAMLRMGQLPGSSQVSAAASLEPSRDRHATSLGIAPELRVAIQITIATAVATGVGFMIDPQRFYWASLSALLCFTGVNNAGEQVRKSLYRLIGTVIGVILGSAIATSIGTNSVADATAILVSMFIGLYFARINYTFLAIGVTISISLVFLQLNELSNSLLFERVLETGAGAIVAALTALFILPLSPKRVIQTARSKYLKDLSQLITAAIDFLHDPANESELLGWSREIDSDYISLKSAISPLQWSMLGSLNRQVTELLSISTALRNYTKSLVSDVKRPAKLPNESVDELESICIQLKTSLKSLTDPTYGKTTPYLRIGSLLETSKPKLGVISTPNALTKIDLILRDLSLIDASLASLASHLEVSEANLDISALGQPSPVNSKGAAHP